jgi:hypothetical protein
MSLFLYGNYEKMLKIRDKILIPKLNYKPWDDKGYNNDKYQAILSPCEKVSLQFCKDVIQLEYRTEKFLFYKDGKINENIKVITYSLIDILNPDKIISVFCEDITTKFKNYEFNFY